VANSSTLSGESCPKSVLSAIGRMRAKHRGPLRPRRGDEAVPAGDADLPGASAPEAAQRIADAIGDVEIERLRESRSSGSGGRHSYGLERQVEPLVMASEISGLGPLRGFLKLGNLVVRLNVPFSDLPKRHPAFVERAGRRDDSINNLESGIRNSQDSRNSMEARDSRDSTEARHSRGTGARAASGGQRAAVRDDGQRRVLKQSGRGHRAPGLFGDD
jgi:hypothetical protein